MERDCREDGDFVGNDSFRELILFFFIFSSGFLFICGLRSVERTEIWTWAYGS